MSQERLKLLIGRAETAAAQMAEQEIEELRELVESCPRGLRVVRLVRRRTVRQAAPESLRRRLEIREEHPFGFSGSATVAGKVTITNNH